MMKFLENDHDLEIARWGREPRKDELHPSSVADSLRRVDESLILEIRVALTASLRSLRVLL